MIFLCKRKHRLTFWSYLMTLGTTVTTMNATLNGLAADIAALKTAVAAIPTSTPPATVDPAALQPINDKLDAIKNEVTVP